MHNSNPFDTTEVDQTRQEMGQDNERQQKDDNPFIDCIEKEVNDQNQVVINKYTPTTLGRARSQSESAVNRQKYSNQQKSKVDDIDLLDGASNLYAGLFHHESPYDCVILHQNINAFRKSEELNRSSQSYKNNNSKHTTYDVNPKFRDSFLEGSTAYVSPQPQQEEKKKRQSLFKRISLFGKKKSDLAYFEIIDQSKPEQKQEISSKPPKKFTRVDMLKKFD
ncbi:13805_t:CDS:2 [Funneliformis geosporum]|uniref:18414_t:CDS:1 n=1 Tax=Funneliformis geosporum TaxID=1117311 RepID=A0A9W4WNB2_9GLOM|nr:13805_t:CDS:2 [Funneliformis geosporum]CAI2166577.1 18414_t:CDS:2 [Funneliformis geosporum]